MNVTRDNTWNVPADRTFDRCWLLSLVLWMLLLLCRKLEMVLNVILDSLVKEVGWSSGYRAVHWENRVDSKCVSIW